MLRKLAACRLCGAAVLAVPGDAPVPRPHLRAEPREAVAVRHRELLQVAELLRALLAVLDRDRLRLADPRLRPYLEPDLRRLAALHRPDRQPIGGKPGLGLAALEAQAGLERGQRPLVTQLVLRHRSDPAVLPGHPVRLVEPLRLVAERGAGEAVGRVGLHAVLGQVDRQPPAQPVLVRGAVDPERQARDRRERDVAPARPRARVLPRGTRVRVVGDAGHGQPLEALAAAHLRRLAGELAAVRVQAEQVAVEVHRRAGALEVAAARAPDRGRLAEQDLIAAVAGRGERTGGRADEAAVDLRGLAHPAVAALDVLRRQPAALVRLVVDRPAVDAGEMRAERPREGAELAGLGAADAALVRGALATRGPRRAGRGYREQ